MLFQFFFCSNRWSEIFWKERCWLQHRSELITSHSLTNLAPNMRMYFCGPQVACAIFSSPAPKALTFTPCVRTSRTMNIKRSFILFFCSSQCTDPSGQTWWFRKQTPNSPLCLFQLELVLLWQFFLLVWLQLFWSSVWKGQWMNDAEYALQWHFIADYCLHKMDFSFEVMFVLFERTSTQSWLCVLLSNRRSTQRHHVVREGPHSYQSLQHSSPVQPAPSAAETLSFQEPVPSGGTGADLESHPLMDYDYTNKNYENIWTFYCLELILTKNTLEKVKNCVIMQCHFWQKDIEEDKKTVPSCNVIQTEVLLRCWLGETCCCGIDTGLCIAYIFCVATWRTIDNDSAGILLNLNEMSLNCFWHSVPDSHRLCWQVWTKSACCQNCLATSFPGFLCWILWRMLMLW